MGGVVTVEVVDRDAADVLEARLRARAAGASKRLERVGLLGEPGARVVQVRDLVGAAVGHRHVARALEQRDDVSCHHRDAPIGEHGAHARKRRADQHPHDRQHDHELDQRQPSNTFSGVPMHALL